ncbi:hypothetical protein ACB092_06G035000 [Castanea dentata]
MNTLMRIVVTGWVVCHNLTGHVHQLHLRSIPPSDGLFTTDDQYGAQLEAYKRSRLVGKINPSLLDVKYLTYLDLSYNDFYGTQIPKFLGSMGSLRYLNLSNARFGGMIPHQLGNLSNMHYLDLGGNYGYNLYVLGLQWLFGLPLLQHLDLSYVDLSQASDWLQVTNKLPSLLKMWLSGCHLGFTRLIPNINFSSLTTLDLSSTTLENNLIPKWNMTSLRHLDLSYNFFNSSIPNWLYNFSHLEFLNLGFNNFQGTISSAIGNLTFAIRIDFSSNELNGKVPRSLGNLCNLREIRISYNKWNQKISELLEKTLEMNDARLSRHLINELGQFKNLVVSIGNLSSFRSLNLVTNQINGTLPQCFGQLSKLEYLNIDSNILEGVVFKVHFANLMRLTTLVASQNQLTLELNTSYLRSWKLGPKFPLWFCSQKHLEFLDISNTRILDMNEVKHMKFLNPRKNLLSREISDCWEMWQSLFALNLGNNNFIGSIPISIDNKFFGKIPLSLKNCEQLVTFDIAKIKFVGSIPSWMGYTLSKLVILNLHSNNFHGYIPKELIPKCVHNFSSMTQATYHNSKYPFLLYQQSLGYNSIPFESELLMNKGKVLEYSTTLQMVKIIDFSKNNLSGEIPR